MKELELDRAIAVLSGLEYDPLKNDTTDSSMVEWITADKRKMLIGEMTNKHLKNAINFLKRMYHPTSEYHCDSDWWKIENSVNRRGDSAKIDVLEKFGKAVAHTRALNLNPRYKYLIKEAIKRGLKI